VKKFKIYILLIICALLILGGCKNPGISNKSDDTIVNDSIIKTSGFNISSSSTELNTSAKGTVFAKGINGNVENIQIIALIEIDYNDWGGVTFYIPDDWNISSITSSFPENESQKNPGDYISTLTTADSKYELNKMIEIGKNRNYIPMGGGMGTVVIDLSLEDVEDKPETFNMVIGVGSDETDGVMIDNPDSISIELSLSSDE